MGELAAVPGLLGRLDHPMMVVTAAAGDERAGCLVGFHTQCSIHPARVLVFLSERNRTFDVAERATHLAVHYLRADQRELAALFGSRTGDEVDKFARCAWHRGPADVPVLDDCPDHLVGRIVARVDGGDHVGHLLDPVAAERTTGAWRQLGFQDVTDLEPGHAP